MDRKCLKLCSQLTLFFAISTGAFADITEPAVEFYQISPATTMMQYPIFIYQQDTTGWKQIGYAADPSITVYAGPFDIQGKNGAPPTITFKLVSAVLSSDETAVISWTGGCIFSVTGNTITQSTTEPCLSGQNSIVNINEGSSIYGTNFYSISMASHSLPAMTTNSDYPSAYHLPQYQKNNRKVSFYNATQYPTIGLYNTKTSETTYVNSGIPTIKSYPGTNEVDSYVWQMGGGGTNGCTVGSTCWNYSGGVFSQDPLQIYGVYATTFEATYHKAVSSTVNPAIHFVANGNYDLSVVNGFTFKGILTPAEPTYCSTQTPLQYANPKGDLFIYKVSPKKVMASFPKADVNGGNVYSQSIQGLCNAISSQPFTQAYNATTQSTFTYTPPTTTFLSVFNGSSKFLGCMSPCQYVTYVSSLYNSKLPADQQPQQYKDLLAAYGTNNGVHNTMSDIVGQFCCSGAYSPASDGKQSCDTAGMGYPQPYPSYPPGIAINYTNNQYGLINNSSYVRSMNGVVTPVQLQNQPPTAPLTNNNSPAVDFTQAAAKNTYAYQYGDPIANVGCPGDTDFLAYVFDDTTPGNNPNMTFITKATGIEVNNLTKTGATFNWEAPEDSNSVPNITYTANVYLAGTTSLVTSCQSSALTCSVTALSANTDYQVQIVSQDGSLTSHSKLYNFTTNDRGVILQAPVLTLTAFSDSEADISWTTASDPTDPSATFTYYVSVNNGAGTITSTGINKASITGLSPGTTQYVVTVFATETAGKNKNMRINSNAVTFVMETISPAPVITSIIPKDSARVATVNWTRSTTSSGDGIVYFAHWNEATSAPMSFSGDGPYNYQIAPLSDGVLYTVTILACDATLETQCVESSPQQVCIGTCGQGSLTQPSNVAATNVTTNAATIGWTASTDSYSGAAITGYTVNVSTKPDATGGQQVNVDAATLQAPITNLTADTVYYTTVTANDNLHHTATSAPVEFTTETIPETFTVPRIKSVTATSPFSATVEWTQGADNLNHEVSYTVNLNGVAYVSDISDLNTNLGGLSPNTQYAVSVTVCDTVNKACSAASAEQTFTTPSESLVVSGLTAGVTGETTQALSWSPATGGGTDVINYTINYIDTLNQSHFADPVGSATSATLMNLSPSTSYSATVTACDKITSICSEKSNQVSFTTNAASQPVLSNLAFTPQRIVANLINIPGSSVTLTCLGDPAHGCNGRISNATIVSASATCGSFGPFVNQPIKDNIATIQMIGNLRVIPCDVTLTVSYDGQKIAGTVYNVPVN